jgi:DNA mismatch repair protein MSH5
VSVVYTPQVGYLVAVQEDDVHLLQGTSHGGDNPQSNEPKTSNGLRAVDEFSEWNATASLVRVESSLFSFVYTESGVHYFKHPVVDELDSTIGDIKSEITDRKHFLLLQLEDQLLNVEDQLQELSVVISTLDALISLGELAIEHNLIQPEICEEQGILIKNGRHLLQELTVDNFVPNDTFVNHAKNVALVTGPNASGKSVYLKQVGLIVYLAHIGSFVPCERARIGLVDRMFTRISSKETVSSPQSSFAIDLQQVSRMLSTRTHRSLCLVDEFGKGTAPVDGIALLAATVKDFVRHGCMAVVVLHFTEILNDGVLSAEDLTKVASFRMEMLETPHAENGERYSKEWGECTPLFKLKHGVSSSSEGLPCAHSAGLSDIVLKRASVVKKCILEGKSISPDASQGNPVLCNKNNAILLATFLQTTQWTGNDMSSSTTDLLALI